MLEISKKDNGLKIAEWKNIWWANCSDESFSFSTFSNEESAKKWKWEIFFWPGEYEKSWIEIQWIDITKNYETAYLWKIDSKLVLNLSSNLEWFLDNFYDKVKESIDVLAINIWSDAFDEKILIDIINKIQAKYVIFNWDISKIKETFQNIEKVDSVKIWAISVAEDLAIKYYSL